MTTTKTCSFCKEPAAEHQGVTLDPPVCPLHEDLLLLVEAMKKAGKEISLKTVTANLIEARANAGGWTLTPEQLPTLLPAFLEAAEAATPGPQAKKMLVK
jgi:hypothetical protein